MIRKPHYRRILLVAGVVLLVPSLLLLFGGMLGVLTIDNLPEVLQFKMRSLGSFAVAGCLMAAIGSLEP
ncbi:hypothetical protein [Thermomonas sp.]|uniref:hypothetical protein n=1 Tax=Thermomonas sp. TaxID=1971895 RepID=UPI00248A0B0D|nr:hypothetical protein [Thermomonas sp.]MDI1253005.1 hypothetical protein [Thermomonas sp.]